MPRINPTVSKKAKYIYDKWDTGERGHKVSEAIIQYNNSTTDIETLHKKVEELKERVSRLEGKNEHI